MNSVGDAFGYPFRSPSWASTILLQGLILIIPIIGQIALLGWLLATIDNLPAGRQEMAAPGFHLERGIKLFGVQLLYGIGLFLIPLILQVVGSATMGQSSGAGGAIVSLAVILELAASLLLAFLLPALIMRTSE